MVVKKRNSRPERYADNWRDIQFELYEPFLHERMTILDVGSGRKPVLPVDRRPHDCRYIGLDILTDELDAAPSGSYDETFTQDLRVPLHALHGHADLIVSWQVFEHIKPLTVAVDNLHSYLKTGGHLYALLSGRNAHFAILNRLVPDRFGIRAMEMLLDRPPESVFKANYDHCTQWGLEGLFSDWSDVKVVPYFRGGEYFGFLPPLKNAYLKVEDWLSASERNDWATHYAVIAERSKEAEST